MFMFAARTARHIPTRTRGERALHYSSAVPMHVTALGFSWCPGHAFSTQGMQTGVTWAPRHPVSQSLSVVHTTQTPTPVWGVFDHLGSSSRTQTRLQAASQDSLFFSKGKRPTGLGPRPQLSPEGQGICSSCSGTGKLVCPHCNGTGWMSRGGFNKRNPIPKNVINSKWTAMQETIGWRHFRCIQVRKGTGPSSVTFLLMQASCDPTAQLWVNRETLRDRARWAAGWLQMSEMGLNITGDNDPATATPPQDSPTQATATTGHAGSDSNSTASSNSSSSMADSHRTAHSGDESHGSSLSSQQATPPGSSGVASGKGFLIKAVRGRGVRGAASEADPGAKPCRSCGGTGITVCKQCDASGVVLIHL